MPTCSRCQIDKPIDEFSARKDGRRQSHCKSCGRDYLKAHYQENRSWYLERNKRRKLELRKRLWEYLRTKQCIDCGESETLYLDFDHREPNKKEFNISNAIGRSMSWQRVETEIQKCDIRCVKCHRLRTAQQFGWFRFDQG